MPNFIFKTAFHFLLYHNYFEILIRLVQSIEKENFFLKFLKDEKLINRIVDMLIYILEEEVIYPLSAVKNKYTNLPIDYDCFDYDEEPDETEIEKNNRTNRSKVKEYLTQICEEIHKREDFIKRNDFNI